MLQSRARGIKARKAVVHQRTKRSLEQNDNSNIVKVVDRCTQMVLEKLERIEGRITALEANQK